MIRANSWRTDGRVRHDRIELFLFGQPRVGTTSLIDNWLPERKRTLTLDDRQKRLIVREVRDEIELRNYIRISHTRPHGVMFLFNICDTDTFLYMIALLQKLKPVFNSNTIRYLVGTQRDRRSGEENEPNETSIEDAVMLAMRNLMRYRETSATTGEGVEGAFMSVVNDVHRLGLRLEDQSLIANLGSYMSLPRRGGQDLLVEFERKQSLDSDSSEYTSEFGSAGSDIDDFVDVSSIFLDDNAADIVTGDDRSKDKQDMEPEEDLCSKL